MGQQILIGAESRRRWSDGQKLSILREVGLDGARVADIARYVGFQMAEVAIPRNVFADILRMIAELRPLPNTSTA